MASEVSVTPSCIAAMKCGGSAVMRSTCARARGCPARSSSRIRVRREVTRPYSAATKNAFSSDQPGEGEELEREGHAACAVAGAQVLGGKSSSKRPES